MNKKLKFLLLALLLVTAVFSFYQKPKSPQSVKNQAAQSQATLVIDYGEGKKETYSFTPRAGQTVFDALKTATEQKGIPLVIQQYDFGIFVKSIGGLESSAKMAWIYFVNGTSGTVAADKVELKSGDLIEWRYIKPTE